MQQQARRLSERTPASEMLSLATHILSLPCPETDAVVVFQGLGETWRVAHAVFDRNDFDSRILLLAAFNTRESMNPAFSPETLQAKPYNLENVEGVIIGEHAEHTWGQAEWVCEQIVEHGIQSITLHASPYHMVRAYLTMLKCMLVRGLRIPLFAVPTAVPPSRIVPESGIDSWDSAHGEAARIPVYQQKENVATLEELREFLNWIWEQPLLASYGF